MSNIVQYDLFQTKEECEMSALRTQMTAVKLSGDKVRKAVFGRTSELTKRVLELEERLQIIERGICQK